MRRQRLHRDPDKPLRDEIRRLRRTASDDDGIMEMCNAVEELIAKGWVQRPGPFERKPAELHPAWGGKLPPEKP